MIRGIGKRSKKTNKKGIERDESANKATERRRTAMRDERRSAGILDVLGDVGAQGQEG
jgi:hypothetical protein